MTGHSLRNRLQVERTKERRVLDLLHRGVRWPRRRGRRGLVAGGFATGAPLASAVGASPRKRLRRGRSGSAFPSARVRSVLDGTVDPMSQKKKSEDAGPFPRNTNAMGRTTRARRDGRPTTCCSPFADSGPQ